MSEFVKLKDYQNILINKDGIVISERGNILKHHLRKNQQQYPMVRLISGLVFVHRLIAIAFIPNPDNLPFVNHKDGNKGNFSIDNLEWCTTRQNIDHAMATGLVRRGKKIHTSVLDEIQVYTIRKCYDDGLRVCRIAEYFDVHYSSAYFIAKRVNWKHL